MISSLIKYRLLYAYICIKSLFSLNVKDICKEIVMIDGLLLKYVDEENKTFDVCLEALLNNKEAIKYLPKNLTVKNLNVLNSIYSNHKKSINSPIKLFNKKNA